MDSAQRAERIRVLGPTLPPDLTAGAAALKANPRAPADPQASRLLALLEVAYLAASADDKLSEQEIDHLVANLNNWFGKSLEPAFLVDIFDHLGAELARDGFQGRLKAIASILDPDNRRLAYRLACVTALCDHEVHDDELELLGGIADAFGIPAEEAQDLFDALDDAVTATA